MEPELTIGTTFLASLDVTSLARSLLRPSVDTISLPQHHLQLKLPLKCGHIPDALDSWPFQTFNPVAFMMANPAKAGLCRHFSTCRPSTLRTVDLIQRRCLAQISSLQPTPNGSLSRHTLSRAPFHSSVSRPILPAGPRKSSCDQFAEISFGNQTDDGAQR